MPVVRRAQAMLRRLEEAEQTNAQQATLFDVVPSVETAPLIPAAPHTVEVIPEEVTSLLSTLDALDIDNMSPREALSTLYELKSQAKAIEDSTN